MPIDLRLQPLRQFICDTCHQVILTPEQGYVEWLRESSGKAREFRIVHHALYSPRRPAKYCYRHEGTEGQSDLPLSDFLGGDGIANILRFIDPGHHLDPLYSGPMVEDLREWVVLSRRLFLPYFEEARWYWQAAEQDGFFDGANDVWPYLPSNLRTLIENYGDKPGWSSTT